MNRILILLASWLVMGFNTNAVAHIYKNVTVKCPIYEDGKAKPGSFEGK